MNKPDPELAVNLGYLYARRLPDNRIVGVALLTFSRARIVIGDDWGPSDGW